MMNTLNGYERESLTPSQTLVYLATHKDGKYLPFMNRSFISFSYGGKNIEDFNLLATINGDRLSRDAYSSFDDLTTTYDTILGQFYWGSYYRVNSLTLNLATDGMTQNELDDFKYWFLPGEGKELILSEHPNRAIIARVSLPPQLNLLPFEKKVKIPIGIAGGQIDGYEQYDEVRTYTTSTTLYKGEIELLFVMDEPFWYAKLNILGNQDVLQGYYSESWIDANGLNVEVRNTPDALKIIYEDRIPLGSTTNISVFLGGNVFATIVYKLNSYIVTPITEEEYNDKYDVNNTEIVQSYFNNGDLLPTLYPNPSGSGAYLYYKGAVIATVNGDEVFGGRIGGADLSTMGDNESGLTLANDDKANLYYAGTAPSPLKIKFQLSPLFDGETYKIISPYNSASVNKPAYNSIIFKATKEHHFNFSIPGLYTSYNNIFKLIDLDVVNLGAWLTLREHIRDTIKHPIIRAWANRIIDRYDTIDGAGQISNNNLTIEELRNSLKTGMKYLFLNNYLETMPAAFEFDGKTGKAKGIFKLRNPNKVVYGDSFSDWNDAAPLDTEENIAENLLILVEDVGDMVKSNYLILDERNVLDDSFKVQSWTADHPNYSYEISHNLDNNLEHLQFEFKNLYL